MPPQLVEIMSHVYGSVANGVLGRGLFDSPSIDEVAQEYQRFKNLEMA